MSRSANLELALYAAGVAIAQVRAGRSLSDALADLEPGAGLRAAVQDLAYGTLRNLGLLDALLAELLRKPVKPALHALLLCALYQLRARPRSGHTTVDQTVRAVSRLEPAAKGLANAVLRNYLRQTDALVARCNSEAAHYSYPQWWIERVRAAWPQRWESVLNAGNLHPPMTLRVNRRRLTAEQYLAKLGERGLAGELVGAQAILLERPLPIEALPGFAAGEVSVQDAGAQLAAPLLDVRPGMRVLDACAAPGGKAGHILELADCALTALDSDPARLPRIGDNLARLGYSARVVCGDCLSPEGWFDGELFERILLDAPCTASGVVKRHPDIKWLRRESDIARLAAIQGRMLDALWQQLAPGGKLLYATCSVFPQENAQTIASFLARTNAALRLPLAELDAGQLLPDARHDGFFYALLEKH
ncbi:MAG: 16S rRNA (cytosine(967)-C(5))-methyltransferase [Betaproteobacteria bacterium RIFCSPLOWO2_12_FULL_64_23]|nr:MAG: 16S rRNA (cytosine(967)-C(5))-methyltransferase [Betaproteobacteria bacterium RIFCSPLOWO2_12_FULL_64_23]